MDNLSVRFTDSSLYTREPFGRGNPSPTRGVWWECVFLRFFDKLRMTNRAQSKLCLGKSEHSSADGFSLTRVEIVSLKMFFSAPFGGCALAVC